MSALSASPEVATAPASWYCITGSNDTYWRVEAPAKAVGGKVFLIPESAAWERDDRGRFKRRVPGGFYAVTQPNEDTVMPWRYLVDRNDPAYFELEFPLHEGTMVWTRPDLARATLAKAMAVRNGTRVVAEVDDNYLGDAKLNLFTKSNDWGDATRREHLQAHGSMHALVTSTAWLRDRYAKALRKMFKLGRSELPEMHVCRNNVDPADWPARVEGSGRVRVGWMGSPSHVWDVNLMWPAMLHAKNLGCETWTVGYDPTNPWGTLDVNPALMSEKSRFNIAQWQKVGARNQPWVKPEKYQRIAMPLDIGLAPLRTDEFTLGKSDCKAIEYTIAGAACILQNNIVYNKDWVHGETCLMAGSPQQFLEATELLVRKPDLRERLVAAAQQYVREERGLKQIREEWGAAISG